MLKLLRAEARPERAMEQVHCGNAADTLRLGAVMGARLWPGGDLALNAESVVAKPESEPNRVGCMLPDRQDQVPRALLDRL
jgi:hypothetical protein